ncbi:hypothetical protein SprV_0200903400 [Sparganum proliferum]
MNISVQRREEKTGAAIYEANRIAAAKSNGRLANPKYLAFSMPTIRHFQYVRAANAHSAHKSVSLDTFAPNVPSTQRLPHLPPSPLPHTPRRPPPPSPPIALSLLCRRHHPACPNVCIDRSGQHQNQHDFTHYPHRWDDIRCLINFKHHQNPHLQLCGLGSYLSSLRSHISLTHQPSRSLPIHRTEAGKPVPKAPTYTHRTRLHCPYCPRTFTRFMGLLDHLRIHEDLRQTTAGHITHPPPTPASHGNITTTSTRLPPQVHAGSLLLGSVSMQLQRCMRDPSLRLSRWTSAVAWKAAD